MIELKIDELLSQVDSKYTLVTLAAKRAREINSYYNQLGEAARSSFRRSSSRGLQQAAVDRPRGDLGGQDQRERPEGVGISSRDDDP